MDKSPLSLHMPDADRLTQEEIDATLDLKPASMLVLCYAQWDLDKGVAEQVVDLVYRLEHPELYVRFHADPHPPGYAKAHGGPRQWGMLCARRMNQYYGDLSLPERGRTLHAILGNEVDADYEGGLDEAEASVFYSEAIQGYRSVRPQDVIHVPAPTGAPDTHRRYLQRYKDDGWLYRRSNGSVEPWPWMMIDGHGYNGDLENVVNALHEVAPGYRYAITESNDIADFQWPIDLLGLGKIDWYFYFILNWARGGEGRPPAPPLADDDNKRMSLLRWRDQYDKFRDTIGKGVVIDGGHTEPDPGLPPNPPPPGGHVDQPSFPLPVDEFGNEWAPSYSDMRQAIAQVSAELQLPEVYPLGVFMAEAGDNLNLFDRWSRYNSEALDCIARRDLAGLQAILDRIKAANSNDISFLVHIAWYWWEEYPGDRSPNDPHRYNLQEILQFRKRLIQDHGYAIRTATARLRRYWDQTANAVFASHYDRMAYCGALYNKPAGPSAVPNWAEIQAYYKGKILKAAAIVAPIVEPPPVEPPPPTTHPNTSVVFSFDHWDNSPVGRMSLPPKFICLHGSRSGRTGNPKAQEALGTARYEVSNRFTDENGNTYKLGWHATAGEDLVYVHMEAAQWGYNCRAASDEVIGIEIAQATRTELISDAQVRAIAAYIVHHVDPYWPNVAIPLCSHAELERWGLTGARDGKDDVFPFSDPRFEELKTRVYAELHRLRGTGPVEPPPVEPPVDPTLPTYEQLATLVGVAYHEDGVIIPALSEALATQGFDHVEAARKFLRENDPHRPKP